MEDEVGRGFSELVETMIGSTSSMPLQPQDDTHKHKNAVKVAPYKRCLDETARINHISVKNEGWTIGIVKHSACCAALKYH